MKNNITVAFLFPGQGAQYNGIGKDIYQNHEVVRDTYTEASEALGFDIAEFSFRENNDLIHQTQYTQPVLLTHSVASMRLLHSYAQNININAAAGHSLGEYAALVSAKVISFYEALKLVQKRGLLMGSLGEGEMEALMINAETAQNYANANHCGVAAYNLPEQTVVGGSASDLNSLVLDIKKDYPRFRSTRLKTEGAFHTYYMTKAAMAFREHLAYTKFSDPKHAIFSNFSGEEHPNNDQIIRSNLFFQLFHPVKWLQNICVLKSRPIQMFLELGGGIGKEGTAESKRPNLEGMIKKICKQELEEKLHYSAVINEPSLETTLRKIESIA